MGYLALRRFVEDPEKRAVWSAVVGIIAAVDLPIIWFSVKWWRSLHQVQSSPSTVDPAFWLPLRVSAFGLLAFVILFLMHRYRIALAERNAEVALPEALPDCRRSGQPVRGGGVMSSMMNLMVLAQAAAGQVGSGRVTGRLGLCLGQLRNYLGRPRALLAVAVAAPARTCPLARRSEP